mmetsp:Transcript_10981/g.16739  ORF Transcript_10981/g.16739 Transcript_10981/m.16739 type:complete len:650 (+) Transcript_10981:110-2059(+)
MKFEERYFRSLSPGSVNINAAKRVRFPDGSDRVVVAFSDKLTWPDLVNGEICYREINLLSGVYEYRVSGVYGFYSGGNCLLYVSKVPSPSCTDSRGHITGYSLVLSADSEGVEIVQFQDLAVDYNVVDIQTIIFEGASYMCALGSDKMFHIYEMEITGHLRRCAKREAVRSKVSSRLNVSSSSSLPLRFLVEEWDGGGSQCVLGQIDGLVHWDRMAFQSIRQSSQADSNSQQDLADSGFLEISSRLSEECSTTSADHLAASSCDSLQGEHLLDPMSIQSYTIEEGDEEDDDETEAIKADEVDQRTLRTRSTSLGRASPTEDESFSSTDPTPVLLDALSQIYNHHPLRSGRPSNDVTGYEDSIVCVDREENAQHCRSSPSTHAYILDGSISCLSFYSRESSDSRLFRSKYSSHCVAPNRSLPQEGQECQWMRSAHPSPCVLLGLADGTGALLSAEYSAYSSSPSGVEVKALLLEQPEVQNKDMSPGMVSTGGVLAMCAADVTGDGCNEVIIGYESGLVRVVSLVGKESFSDDACGVWNADQVTSHNAEEWSTTCCHFKDLCHIQLPFPIMKIEFGQLLGETGPNGSADQDFYLNHPQLIVVTSKSLHVFTETKNEDESGLVSYADEKTGRVLQLLDRLSAMSSQEWHRSG